MNSITIVNILNAPNHLYYLSHQRKPAICDFWFKPCWIRVFSDTWRIKLFKFIIISCLCVPFIVTALLLLYNTAHKSRAFSRSPHFWVNLNWVTGHVPCNALLFLIVQGLAGRLVLLDLSEGTKGGMMDLNIFNLPNVEISKGLVFLVKTCMLYLLLYLSPRILIDFIF